MIDIFLAHPWLKTALKIAVAVVGAGTLGIVAVYGAAKAYDLAYADRIVPGVVAFDINLSGMTPAAAQEKIRTRMDQALNDGLVFNVGDETIALADKKNFVRYDVDGVVRQAMAVGRGSSLLGNTIRRLTLNLHPERLTIPVAINTDDISRELKQRVQQKLVAPLDAKLTINVGRAGDAPTVTIEPERDGKVIDFDPAMAALKTKAETFAFEPITVQVTDVQPMIRAKDIEPLATQVPDWLSHAPFKLEAEGNSWTVTSAMLADWISVTGTNEGWMLELNSDRVDAALQQLTKGLLDEPIDGNLVLADGKVKEFVAPQEGTRLNPAETIRRIEDGWANGSSTIAVPLEKIVPKIAGTDAEEMGIREILGVGRSNYSGSPSNRRKNIAHGADIVGGALIAPDEEFSLLKRLGTIDGKNGWLPELVIKGNKTTPEFGGGLCQIGTTVFRAALYSGLPITERRNHSYRVRYYEPAGMDATIYDPAPDLKFKNDTGHWILVTSRNKDSDVAFTFWGTKDGRVVDITKPRIYNIVAPPEKKIMETTDIPVGTTKCTESAHAGATASFDYTVTYPNGEVKKTNYTSYYKPWGAVCLVGVATPPPVDVFAPLIDTSGINNPN